MNTNTTPDIASINEKRSSLTDNNADEPLELANSDDRLALFENKFVEQWQELTFNLEQLLQELRKKRHNIDTELHKQIEIALQICRSDTGIPSIEEIERRFEIEKSYEIVYEKYLNEIRAHLSQHLLSLDDALKRSLDTVKSQVAEILIEKADLGELTQARGSELINVLAVEIPEQLIPGIPSKLKLAFQILAEFELSYRGLVQYRIRPHLDGLTPKEAKTLKLTVLPSAQQVFINLKIAHIESVRNCEKGLKQLLSEPNQVAFAIVEEFVDRTIRAADVEKEWQLLLQLVRSQIWDNFLGEQGQIQHEWINSVEQATIVDEETSEIDAIFAFINM